MSRHRRSIKDLSLILITMLIATYARELAFQDGLTGFPNRRQYDDALKAAGS